MPRLCTLLLLFFLPLASLAQTTVTDLPPRATEAIERAAAVVASGGLSETQAAEAKDILDSARGFDTQAELSLAAITELKESLAKAERDRKPLERSLSADQTQSFSTWRKGVNDSISDIDLDTRLATERTETQRLRADLNALQAQRASLTGDALVDIERDGELLLRIDALQREIAADLQPQGDQAAALQQAAIARERAELRAVSADLQRRRAERQAAPVRLADLELRMRLLQRELGQREQRLEVLQALSQERAQATMRTLIDELRLRAAALEDGDSLLRMEATENLSLGESLERATLDLIALRSGDFQRAADRDRVSRALADTRARLAIEGPGDAVGPMLVLERRRLESPAVIEKRLNDIRAQINQTQLQQIDINDERRQLSDLARAVDQALDQADAGSDAESAHLRGQLYELLGRRFELLPGMEAVLQRYMTALAQAEIDLQQQLSDTRVLRQMLDEQVYWLPSNAPIDLAWFSRLANGWADLLKPSRFVTSSRLFVARLLDAPLLPSVLLLAFIVLLAVRLRARTWIAALAPPLRRPAEDDLRRTLKVLGLTILAALPWALLVGGIGRILDLAGEPGRFSDSLGHSLRLVAVSVFALEFLRFMCIRRGLAHLHFRWLAGRRQAIQGTLAQGYLVLLPLQFLIALAMIRNQELAIDTAARCALIALCLVMAYLNWRLLAAGAIWTSRGGADEPRPIRRALRLGFTLLLPALAVLMINGYVFSGYVLLGCLWGSLFTAMIVGILHGLMSRWSLIGERKLALIRLQAKREAEAGESAGSDEAGADVSDDALDLQTVNAQTRRLLRAVTLALWIGGLLWVWSDVLPALDRLNEISLWQVAGTAEDGSPLIESISLKAVLFGLLALALTVIGARNLPGLLELGLLSRTGIDASTRYAIDAMSRYAIIIVGTVVGLSLLGLRWSQLQWMAAALTVGLGFGLQEIFANFVSGLILLSERPFRVGDVITIGDQTGTVTRVSTRATTLVDFDGKEVVVPNKTFITDRLVNWTLSDTKTRLILNVGVAYGTAVERVHELLLQIAREHPQVLDEPQPRSWFMAFGASSLDFELRVFVGTMGDRLPVMNELNGRIAAMFDEAGIEIAFPQLDLHVKHLPPGPGAEPEGEVSPA